MTAETMFVKLEERGYTDRGAELVVNVDKIEAVGQLAGTAAWVQVGGRRYNVVETVNQVLDGISVALNMVRGVPGVRIATRGQVPRIVVGDATDPATWIEVRPGADDGGVLIIPPGLAREAAEEMAERIVKWAKGTVET